MIGSGSIRTLIFITGILILFLLYLAGERWTLSRRLQVLPLRIAVTGTRGKSSVVRLLAAVLQEAGYRVLAKTTGSKPGVLFPDSSEQDLIRRGPPSLLEQKRILKMASQWRARSLVVEMMSIRPESLWVESQGLIRPHLLVVTNIRPDHLEHGMGSPARTARSFAAAVPPEGAVFVPEEDLHPAFKEACDRADAELVIVPQEQPRPPSPPVAGGEFDPNLRLVRAVAGHLGIESSQVDRAVDTVRPDFGSLKIWNLRPAAESFSWICVSAFAANEPESTRAVVDKLREWQLLQGRKVIGLINLRRDRGGRTRQWIEALEQGRFPELDGLVATGAHAAAFVRKMDRLSSGMSLHNAGVTGPDQIMQKLEGWISEEAVILGMGNMAGVGEDLVRYWQVEGEAYAL